TAINYAADASTYGGVRRVERSILHASMLLREKRRIVVAQSEIDGQLAGDLPGVLRVEAEAVVAQSQRILRRKRQAGGIAHQEAGVSKPGRPVRKRDTGGVGVGCFRLRKP